MHTGNSVAVKEELNLWVEIEYIAFKMAFNVNDYNGQRFMSQFDYLQGWYVILSKFTESLFIVLNLLGRLKNLSGFSILGFLFVHIPTV